MLERFLSRTPSGALFKYRVCLHSRESEAVAKVKQSPVEAVEVIFQRQIDAGIGNEPNTSIEGERTVGVGFEKPIPTQPTRRAFVVQSTLHHQSSFFILHTCSS